jgi:hypothetical protein
MHYTFLNSEKAPEILKSFLSTLVSYFTYEVHLLGWSLVLVVVLTRCSYLAALCCWAPAVAEWVPEVVQAVLVIRVVFLFQVGFAMMAVVVVEVAIGEVVVMAVAVESVAEEPAVQSLMLDPV